MNKHTVFVAGKRFVLLSDDDEKYVADLAAEVTEAITKIAAQNPSFDRRSAALLCALDYADDKYKEIANRKRLSDSAKPIIVQAEKQAKQLREMKDKIAQRDKMIEDTRQAQDELKAKIRELEGEKKALEKQLEASAKEIERLKDSYEIRTAENRELSRELEELRELQDEETSGSPKPASGKKPGQNGTSGGQYSLFEDEA